MTIPESTLNGWTTQGAVSNSKRTYRSIENALENPRYGLGEFKYEYKSHLQGSYANYTNTWGGSDVDIVVKLTEPFVGDTSDLKPAEQERYDTKYLDSDYHSFGGWASFGSHLRRFVVLLTGQGSISNLHELNFRIDVRNWVHSGATE